MTITLRFIAVFTITLAISNSVFGQSSDNVKYVILYDVSGSTNFLDKRGFLNEFLLRTIGERNDSMKKMNSFQIIFFGSEISSPHSTHFNLPSLRNPRDFDARRIATLNIVKRMESQKRFNQFSHLHAALDEVIAHSLDTVAGVFIFTDGKLERNDVDIANGVAPDVSEYRKNIRSKIEIIRNTGIPVFLVQTSYSKTNPYFSFPRSFPNTHVDRGDDFFWLYNEAVADSVTKAYSVFNDFLSRAGDLMMKTRETNYIAGDDVVSTMVALHQINVLADVIGITDIRSAAELAGIDSTTKANVQQLRTLMAQSSLNPSQVNDVGNSIDALSSSNGEVNKLRGTLQSTASTHQLLSSGITSQLDVKEGLDPMQIASDAVPLISSGLEQEVIKGLTRYLIKRTEQEALYLLFDKIDVKMALMNTYFRDTLFHNTYNFISNFKKRQDLLLVKEALQKDINELHDNLAKHSKIRESEALVTLTFVFEAISSIQSSGTLEGAFEDIQLLAEKWNKEGPPKTSAEKGIALFTFLVDALKKYDLVDNYRKLSPEQLKDLSRMLIVYYTSKFPADYQSVQLVKIGEHVSALYKQFHRTRDQINLLQSSFSTTQTHYSEWQALRRDILIGALREMTDLLIASIELGGEFRKAGESEKELIAKIGEAKYQAQRMVESWFLIRDRKHVEAIINLLPIVKTVIQSNPDLQDYLSGKLADNKHKMTNKNAPLRNQLVRWDYKKAEILLKKLTPTVQAEISTWNREPNITLQELKERLAKNNLPELEMVITGTSIPINDVVTFLTKVKLVEDIDKLKNLDLDFQVASSFALTFLQFTELSEKVEDMITIAAEVSTSVEADDIKNVLLKYSLPPASYRIKREENFALMINAYTGIGTNLAANRNLIIAAPLGLEASFRFKNRKSSFSVLATPIDLGNAINYQLLGNSTTSENEIFSWKNIYSPGAFLILGLSKNHPFSVGVGYQANPNRYSMFVAFDLPLIRVR